ncbi:tRNA-dependent cyclodipeptide synthase [Roseofilum casamattae]|uniref:Cyclodipeptide synthase n=1 Tax=Roseofilum casamattae BLCC-M143 TaxID=3022442 RepID=A0ABT7BVE9_9CYAN|nr:tRNA-dependent cyclodipeptide synthase [Roseofilum casamattae]MDJ1183160.1 tRNA-dependent cyclodipeptide synthase [Roseofilum casamattae BLCC-M143]
MSTQETIVQNIDWNQFSIEQLKQIQSEVCKAIYQKQSSSKLTSPTTSQAGNYKVSVAKVFPRPLRHSLTDYQNCIFLISLGSKNVTHSNRLKACIEWISQNFQTCTVVVVDSIYRLTLEIRHQFIGERALQEALQTGQEFIDRNRDYFAQWEQQCQFQFKCTSDIEMEYESRFTQYYQQLQMLYQANVSFQSMVDRFARDYLNRGKERTPNSEREDRPQESVLAKTYCLEESALFTCLVEEKNCPFIYPGSIKTFEEISDGLYPDVPQPLQSMIWVSLRLNKKRES